MIRCFRNASNINKIIITCNPPVSSRSRVSLLIYCACTNVYEMTINGTGIYDLTMTCFQTGSSDTNDIALLTQTLRNIYVSTTVHSKSPNNVTAVRR